MNTVTVTHIQEARVIGLDLWEKPCHHLALRGHFVPIDITGELVADFVG